MKNVVGAFALRASQLVGSTYAITGAFLLVLVWAVCGPFLGFSETWQIAINTITTIVTFLIVFILQNSQNRDTAAVHLKLDEILIALQETDSSLAEIEQADDMDIESARHEHHKHLNT